MLSAHRACVRACMLSYVGLFAALQTVARQAPLSIEFSRQEYWSGLPFPTPRKSSQPRDWTGISCISCIGRWILYHWPPCISSQISLNSMSLILSSDFVNEESEVRDIGSLSKATSYLRAGGILARPAGLQSLSFVMDIVLLSYPCLHRKSLHCPAVSYWLLMKKKKILIKPLHPSTKFDLIFYLKDIWLPWWLRW